MEINSGDAVVFEWPEACGQVTSDWNDEDLVNIDWDLIHALVGSVFVKGGQPGDTLQVEILDRKHKGWGWSGHSGVLVFWLKTSTSHTYTIGRWMEISVTLVSRASQFYSSHFAAQWVSPKVSERINTIPPRLNGGNIDNCDLGTGSKIWLPVFVEGAPFACGDGDSAQGNGEVCGTAVESPMTVTLRLSVPKDISVKELQFYVPSPLAKTDTKDYHVATAHGPDLMENAKNAVRFMIDWLADNYGLTRSQVYILCGAAADLKISEIVDAPNWIISTYLPASIIKW